jgi:hypothetical protein
MNFLERFFCLSPDGGSGATEVLLLGVILCGLLALLTRRFGVEAKVRRGVNRIRVPREAFEGAQPKPRSLQTH